MSLFNYYKFDQNTDNRIKIAAWLSFLMGMGTAGWLALIINFSAVELGLDAFNFGFILTANEIAVVFGFILSVLLAYVSESRMLGILVAFSGLSVILTGFSGFEIGILQFAYGLVGSNFNKFAVNAAVFAFMLSLTQNYFENTRDSLIKHSSDTSDTALIMGKNTAYSLTGSAFGYFLIAATGFFEFSNYYLIIFAILGVPMIAGGIMGTSKALAVRAMKDKVEIIIRGKFFNFYVLTFFTASINIIMVFFGLFLLVSRFGLSVGFAGLIFLIHSALAFFLRHKAVDIMKKRGEDFTMKIRYGITLLFFLAVAFLPFLENENISKFIILILIAAYGLSTLFDNSIKSFISYFASQSEQRSNLVIYTRLNQLAKVVIPLLAGWLWINYEPYSVFGLGAVFAAICWLVSFRIYAAYKDGGE